MKSTNIELRKEALWCICNAVTSGDDIVVGKILHSSPDVLSYLILGTQFSTDRRLILNIIESIERIFKVAEFNH